MDEAEDESEEQAVKVYCGGDVRHERYSDEKKDNASILASATICVYDTTNSIHDTRCSDSIFWGQCEAYDRSNVGNRQCYP